MTVIQTAFYVLVFLLTWFGILAAILLPIDAWTSKHLGWTLTKKEHPWKGVEAVVAWIIFVAPFPLSYFVLSRVVGYKPPFLAESAIVRATHSTQDSSSALEGDVLRISDSLKNIENLTLNQIRADLSKTLELVSRLEREATDRSQKVKDLTHQIELERGRADKARADADAIVSLTQPQIEAIGTVLTSQADATSNRGFWLGVGTSFPIGVISSITASWLWTRRRRVTSNDTNDG